MTISEGAQALKSLESVHILLFSMPLPTL